MQIAIMGFGTIGSGVAELLLKNQKSIVAKSGHNALDIKYILDANWSKKMGLGIAKGVCVAIPCNATEAGGHPVSFVR